MMRTSEMGDVTNIEEHLPHEFFEAMCVNCYYRWIAVVRTNTLLKELWCPSCGLNGNVINTGQSMSD